jgi:hypothetical protein
MSPHRRRLSIRAMVAGFAMAILLAGASPLRAQVILTADGQTDTYTLISNVLGGDPIEHQDCSHPSFGRHITQANDSTLGKAAFVFHMHVTPDNDRCVNFDRQRNEIKTYGPSPAYLKASQGDVTTYRWRFKLDSGFQPSPNFTHIHQIKAGDGDAGAPIITITPRAGSPQIMQIIHTDSSGDGTVLTTSPLAGFKGVWVEAYERITHDFDGTYSLQIRRLDTGALLLSYSNNNIDMWRTGTTFSRPKWGIYRSLNTPSALRDEQVRFDRFCLAKGNDDCPAQQGPSCVTASGSSWQTGSFATQTGTFTAEFDATPSSSPINSVVGLSQGQQSAYTAFAALARFNPSGTIDARDGGVYAAQTTVAYTGGVRYHFRLVVNVPTRTYSIFVTPQNGTEQTIGTNYAFRSEQSGVTSLNWWGVFAQTGSSMMCSFAIH